MASRLTVDEITTVPKARLGAATALKPARLLNTSPELWLNMQRAVDLWDASHRLSEELAKIDPIAA